MEILPHTSKPFSVNRHWLIWLSISLVIGLGSGCSGVQSVAAAPSTSSGGDSRDDQLKKMASVDPVKMQEEVLRFADEFSTRVNLGAEGLQHGGIPLTQTEVLRLKISLSNDILAIASGPNAVSNLLDMTVLVTMTRMAVAARMSPDVFGESGQTLYENCLKSETAIWQLTENVLTPTLQAELRATLEGFQRKNPLMENFLGNRAVDLASIIGESKTGSTKKSGNLLTLFMIDPLAGMDPAVREIAQTRLFAERALYVAQKMPQLLRWQLELLNANALASPTVQQLVSDTNQLTAAVERVTLVVEELPAHVDRQREEMIKALEEQEKQLTPLVDEVRQTLGSGTELSNSLNDTITALDALMDKFGVGEEPPPGPAAPPGEPFHIQDYTQTAAELSETARQLTEMILALDQTIDSPNLKHLSSQISPVMEQAETSGKEIVDYAFMRGVLLILILLAAALLYRIVSSRITTATSSKTN